MVALFVQLSHGIQFLLIHLLSLIFPTFVEFIEFIFQSHLAMVDIFDLFLQGLNLLN